MPPSSHSTWHNTRQRLLNDFKMMPFFNWNAWLQEAEHMFASYFRKARILIISSSSSFSTSLQVLSPVASNGEHTKQSPICSFGFQLLSLQSDSPPQSPGQVQSHCSVSVNRKPFSMWKIRGPILLPAFSACWTCCLLETLILWVSELYLPSKIAV